MLVYMTVSSFEHPGITTWKVIDKRWVLFHQVLRRLDLTKFSNSELVCNKITMDEAGYQWDLGKLEDFSDNFCVFGRTNGIGRNGNEITAGYSFIDLDRFLWFMLVRSMWKKHCKFFKNTYIVSGMASRIPLNWIYSSSLNVCTKFLKWPDYSLLQAGRTRSIICVLQNFMTTC